MKYSDLRVWQEAMDLVSEVYRLSKSFPSEEKYGLASQILKSGCFSTLEYR
jgi:four helix bundle protein